MLHNIFAYSGLFRVAWWNGIIFWTTGRYTAMAAVPSLFGTNGLTNIRTHNVNRLSQCFTSCVGRCLILLMTSHRNALNSSLSDEIDCCSTVSVVGVSFNFLSSCSYFAFKTTKIEWLLLHSNMKVIWFLVCPKLCFFGASVPALCVEVDPHVSLTEVYQSSLALWSWLPSSESKQNF